MNEPRKPNDIETPQQLFELAAELFKGAWVGIDTCWMKQANEASHISFNITSEYSKAARVADTVQECAAILFDIHPDWEIPLPAGLDEALGPDVQVEPSETSQPDPDIELPSKPEIEDGSNIVREKPNAPAPNPPQVKPKFHG